MKNAMTIALIWLNFYSFAQGFFHKSDSVDAVAWKWLNKYRAYYHLPAVKMDTGIRKSESRRIASRWADTIREKRSFRLFHENYDTCIEALTEAVAGHLIKDTTSDFAIFLKTVFKRKIEDLTGIDFVIIYAIYVWDRSKKGHRDIIRTKEKIGYFSIVYAVNWPSKLKYATLPNAQYRMIQLDHYINMGGYLNFLYSASLQFNYTPKMIKN
jgi:hypothetical protein